MLEGGEFVMPGLGLAFESSHGAAICFDANGLWHRTAPRPSGSTTDVMGVALVVKSATVTMGEQYAAETQVYVCESAAIADMRGQWHRPHGQHSATTCLKLS